jgi:hypothetical protein
MSVFNNLFKFESKLTSYFWIFDPRGKPKMYGRHEGREFSRSSVNVVNVTMLILNAYFNIIMYTNIMYNALLLGHRNSRFHNKSYYEENWRKWKNMSLPKSYNILHKTSIRGTFLGVHWGYTEGLHEENQPAIRGIRYFSIRLRVTGCFQNIRNIILFTSSLSGRDLRSVM